jgi:hypothetical protein
MLGLMSRTFTAFICIALSLHCGAAGAIRWGKYSFHEVTSLDSIPHPILWDIYASGPIADRGRPFNGTDLISPGGPPSRRFLTAGSDTAMDTWIVAVEQGGFDYRLMVYLYKHESIIATWTVNCGAKDLTEVVQLFTEPQVCAERRS